MDISNIDFSHVMVVPAVLVGLTITRIMEFLSLVIKKQVKLCLFSVPMAWIFLSLLLQAQFWWGMMAWKGHEFGFVSFLVILVSPMLSYLVCTIICPRVEYLGESGCVVEHFEKYRIWFFGGSAVVIFWTGVEACCVQGVHFFCAKNWFRFIVAGLFLIGLKAKVGDGEKKYYSVRVCLPCVMFALFVLAIFI